VKQESSAEEIEQLRQALAQAQERAFQAEARILTAEARASQAEAQIQTAEAKVIKATAKIQDLEQVRLNLEHQIQVLKRCLFGSRSEKISPDELEALIIEASQEATDQILKAKRPDQNADGSAEGERCAAQPVKASKPQLTRLSPACRLAGCSNISALDFMA
jgi:chromosome segregation ATPase